MNGPVEGVTLICKVIQGSRVLLCCCSTISLTLVCMVKAGVLLLWYSLREEKGIGERISGILRPGLGSGAHHFLFCSAGENIVLGPHPATREVEYLATVLLPWPYHWQEARSPRAPCVILDWDKNFICCFFPWVLISEIAGGILVFGSPLFISEILTSK